jgi:NADH ubiquinone oxidoreductase, 20 Kd subunit
VLVGVSVRFVSRTVPIGMIVMRVRPGVGVGMDGRAVAVAVSPQGDVFERGAHLATNRIWPDVAAPARRPVAPSRASPSVALEQALALFVFLLAQLAGGVAAREYLQRRVDWSRATTVLGGSFASFSKTRPGVSSLQAAHQAMPEPRLVAALGDCALGCGVLGTAAELAGPLEKLFPVDIRIPGCPPAPDAIAEAILAATGMQRCRGFDRI